LDLIKILRNNSSPLYQIRRSWSNSKTPPTRVGGVFAMRDLVDEVGTAIREYDGDIYIPNLER